LVDFFNNYSSIIVFLHVISAVIWVGGMIAIRFAVHYSMQNIEEPKIKLERTLENLKRFFSLVIPAILTLLITAIIMIIGSGFKENTLYSLVIVKELIWSLMTIIFIIIYIKRNKAQKSFLNEDMNTTKNNLIPIANYFIPINILLGIVAIFIGVLLRGL
jgi:uncharacterized membrane protein